MTYTTSGLQFFRSWSEQAQQLRVQGLLKAFWQSSSVRLEPLLHGLLDHTPRSLPTELPWHPHVIRLRQRQNFTGLKANLMTRLGSLCKPGIEEGRLLLWWHTNWVMAALTYLFTIVIRGKTPWSTCAIPIRTAAMSTQREDNFRILQLDKIYLVEVITNYCNNHYKSSCKKS